MVLHGDHAGSIESVDTSLHRARSCRAAASRSSARPRSGTTVSRSTSTVTGSPPSWRSRCGAERMVIFSDTDGFLADPRDATSTVATRNAGRPARPRRGGARARARQARRGGARAARRRARRRTVRRRRRRSRCGGRCRARAAGSRRRRGRRCDVQLTSPGDDAAATRPARRPRHQPRARRGMHAVRQRRPRLHRPGQQLRRQRPRPRAPRRHRGDHRPGGDADQRAPVVRQPGARRVPRRARTRWCPPSCRAPASSTPAPRRSRWPSS